MFNSVNAKNSLPSPPLKPYREEAQTVVPKPLISAEILLEVARRLSFDVSPQQFAHRLTPSLISNSVFEGFNSLESCRHWIELIDLWLKGQAGIFSLPIKKEHLKVLKEVLVDFEALYEKMGMVTPAEGNVSQELLNDVSKALKMKKVCYLPLGYTGGPKNDGHEIPLKCVLKEKHIEAICLNLGGGSQFHPLLDWSESATEKYDFQFFPFLIPSARFFGERGREFLEAMLLLKRSKKGLWDAPYSAEDIYGALATLGSIQEPNNEERDERSSKPQFTPTCADMAIVLIIKDVLFDLGYKRADVQRFFCIEKFWTLLAFASKENLDDWTLVKHAIRNFSIKIVNSREGVLSEDEKTLFHEVFSLLSVKAEEKIRNYYSQNTSLLVDRPFPESVFITTQYTIPEPMWTQKKQEGKHSLSLESGSLPEAKFSDKESILALFTRWEKVTLDLNNTSDVRKIHTVLNFLYEAFLTVPIPHPYENDLWDQLSLDSIAPLLNRLSSLQQQVLGLDQERNSDLKNVYAGQKFVIATFIYLIADKLIRRKFSKEFEKFAPQLPLRACQTFYGSEDDPYFPLFPSVKASKQWSAALHYITTLKKRKKCSLYPGLTSLNIMRDESMLDLQDTINQMRKAGKSEAIQYLEFLAQFSQTDNPDVNEYGSLWLLQGELIPEDIKTYLGINRALLAIAELPIASRLVGGILHFKYLKERSIFSTPTLHFEDHFEEMSYNDLKLEMPMEFTENQAFCSVRTRDNEGVYKEISVFQRAWLRLVCTKNLTLSSLVIWLEEHLDELKAKEVQNAIQGVLLDSKSIERLEKEPFVYTHLLSVLKRGIEFYQDSHPPTLAFLVCLTCALEGEKLSFEKLGELEKRILEIKRQDPTSPDLDYALRMVYRLGLPRGTESLSELVVNELILNIMGADSSIAAGWITEGANGIERYEKLIQEQFQNQAWTENLVNSVAKRLPLLAEEIKGEITSNYPVISIGKIIFHVLERRVYKKTEDTYLDLNFLNQNILPDGADRRWAPFQMTEFLSWKDGEQFCSVDGLLKIEALSSGSCDFWPFRRFPELESYGIQGWLDKLEADKVEIPFFHHANQFFFWNDRKKNIVITEKTSKRPFALLSCSPGGIHITKFTSSGQLNGRLVLNLNELPKFESWAKGFGKECAPAIWVDPQTQKITEISFFAQGLNFKMEKGGLRSRQFPDFYLIPGELSPELNHFEGALLLRGEDETGVIVFKRNIKSFTTIIRGGAFYSDGGSWAECNQPAFYFFKIDPLSGLLSSNEPNAYMLLTAIFAAQRDYTKALIYLKKASSITSYLSVRSKTWRNVGDFFAMKDRSPDALAFYLRFGMFLLSNDNQISQQAISKNEIKDPQFLGWLVEKMNRYIETQSLNLVGKVSAELRLTNEEERDLLEKVLEQAKLSKEILSLSALKRRLQLLTIKHATISIVPQLYEMKWTFSKLEDSNNLEKVRECLENPPPLVRESAPLPLRVRFDEYGSLKHDFWCFYERILKGEADLPIFFLNRSAVAKWEIDGYRYLLNFIYVNRSLFKHLVYTSDPKKNQEVFEKILMIWGESIQTQEEVVKKIQSCSLKFNYTKFGISLQVPPKPDLRPVEWELIESDELHKFKMKTSEHFKNLSFGLSSSDSKEFTQQNLGFSGEVNGQRPGARPKISRGASKLPEDEGEKPKTQVKSTLLECYLEEAKGYLKTLQDLFQVLKREIEEKANQVPKTDFVLGLRKTGKDLPQITFEGILSQAYEKKDMNLVRAANPSLGPKAIRRLLHKTVKGHLLKIQIHQLRLGIQALESGDQTRFEKALHLNQKLDLEEPEIVLFQSRMGIILREDQHALLDWEFNTSAHHTRRLFHAQAGFGKTTLYQPLATKRMNRMGETPFSLSTKALYQVDTDGLKTMSREAFDFDTTVFEILLAQKIELHQYRWIYSQLYERSGTSGFKLTPEAFYSLFLKYQLALDEGNEELVEAISEILTFLKTRVAAFIDEARVNGGPFTQAKIGIGNQEPLPELDRAVFLDLYKAFLNPEICLKDGRSLPSVIKIQKNEQAQTSEKDKKAIKARLLRNKEWLRPLSGSDKKRAEALVEVYFEHFFNPSFELVGKMHYVRSLKKEEALFVPAHVRQATTSYFEESYITLIATIQGTLQEGLKDQEQARILLEALFKSHQEEVGHTSHLSSIEKQMKIWLNEPKFRLTDYKLDSQVTIEKFYHAVKRCPEALFWFLEHIALDQIMYSTEQLTATPVHLLNAFKSVTLFSADPGPHILYGLPNEGEMIYQDPAILLKAKQRFLAPENSQVLTFKSIQRPLTFFQALDLKVYQDLCMITDPGGMLRDFSVEELAQDFFLFLKEHPSVSYDGFIAFEDGTSSEHATRLMLWREGHDPLELKGHDIPGAIGSFGLDYSKMRFLTFIDPTHRAGANIEQPKNTSLLVLLGEGLTFSSKMQGTLRGRGVLKNEQRIIWGGLESLFRQMQEGTADTITVETIIKWAEKNEEEYRKRELPTSAYQQIDFEVARSAWKKIDQQPSGKEKIALWRQYRAGLVTKVTVDPIERFRGEMTYLQTEEVLQSYASEKYQAFGYKKSKKGKESFDARVTPIISIISEQVPTLAKVQGATLSRTYVYTNQKQQKEVVQQQVKDEVDHLSPDGQYGDLPSLTSATFLKEMLKYTLGAQVTFGSKYLTANFSLTPSAIHTASRGGKPLKTQYLKKLQYFLLVEEKGVQHAFALADSDAAYFKSELNGKKGKVKVALVACSGFIVAHGGDEKWAESALSSQFVQDVQIDLALFGCELRFPKRFAERAQTWVDFGPMWQEIKKAQPFFKRCYHSAVESLVPSAYLLSGSEQN